MTKSELIKRLSAKFPHLSAQDVDLLVNTVLGEISEAIITGRRIELRGFGAFSVRKRESRKARNPKTGESVTVGNRYSIYYRSGKELRERVNKS
jgi:integration host factor subunit beta